MEVRYRMGTELAGVNYADLAYRSWLYDGDPMLYLNSGYRYEELRRKAETGYFEDLLKSVFHDLSQLQCVIAVPDKTLTERTAEKEAKRLAAAKASWSSAESAGEKMPAAPETVRSYGRTAGDGGAGNDNRRHSGHGL